MKILRIGFLVTTMLLSLNMGVAEAATTMAYNDPGRNLPFLFAVFMVTWAAFFGYVFYMVRRERELRRDVEALKHTMEDAVEKKS